MDIDIVEQRLREAIKKRQDEGVMVLNSRMAIKLSRSSQRNVRRGGLWEPRYPKDPLCLLGALGVRVDKLESRTQASNLLGVQDSELEILEAGFEDWHESYTDTPLWRLGRKIAKELEDKIGAIA